jgi:hypothetical protein
MNVKLELSKMQLSKYDLDTNLKDLNLDFVDYAYLQFLVYKHCSATEFINFERMTIKDLSFLFSTEDVSSETTNLMPH